MMLQFVFLHKFSEDFSKLRMCYFPCVWSCSSIRRLPCGMEFTTVFIFSPPYPAKVRWLPCGRAFTIVFIFSSPYPAKVRRLPCGKAFTVCLRF